MPRAFLPQDIVSLAVDVDRGTAPASITAHFARLLSEYAFQNASCDPDERLTSDATYPGYLTTNSGKWTALVPWALAFAFPSPVTLDGLVAVAERSMLPGEGNVVLSGSTNFAGRFAGLGDIDLAQYVFDDRQAFVARVQDLIRRDGSSNLVRVKYLIEYFAPWQSLIATLGNVSMLAQETERIKFEFIDGETPFGVMPVSNVVLPSDRADHTGGAARKSFVFQEVVLALDGDPPWSLAMADELLRYLRFLVREVQTYRDIGNPIKALKRALMLVRILGLDELGSRAEIVLASDMANASSHESCIAELEALWPHLSAEKQAVLEQSLKEKKEIGTTLTAADSLTMECKAVAIEAIEKMKEFLSKEGETIELWAAKKP